MFPLRSLLAIGISVALPFATVSANELYSVLNTSAPTEELAVNFEHGGEEGGWSWYRNDPSRRRDIAQSFKAPSSGTFDKVTFKVRRLGGGVITEQPYRLRVLEADSVTISPDEAHEVASYDATITIDPISDSYMTFNLPKPVEMQAGSYYLVVLSWENSVHSNFIEFAVQSDYSLGAMWQNRSNEAPNFTRLADSRRPGLIFYIH